MQKGYFPTKNIFLAQGYGPKSFSHKNSYALDLGGTYRPFAPFDCKVTQVYAPKDTSKSREVWLTSLDKIQCANGVCDYLTISLTHPADIINMYVGQTFKQFQDLGITTAKMTGYNFGNHCHVELSLGQTPGWDPYYMKQKPAEYININKIKPEQYLYITKETTIEKDVYEGDVYTFIRDGEEGYTSGIYCCDYNMRLRKGPGTNYDVVKVKECTELQKEALTSKNPDDYAVFKKGTNLTAIEIIKNDNNEYWMKTYRGYVCIQDNETKYCSFVEL